MPTRLLANGATVHDWMDPLDHTASHEFEVPAAALAGGAAELVLAIEPRWPDKVT